MKHYPVCEYISPSGAKCHTQVSPKKKYCFWHDPEASKEGPDVKHKLAEWVQAGHSMEGFILRKANLTNLQLIWPNHHEPLNLSYADLYKADLQGAYLHDANLTFANLTKTNLAHANLQNATLVHANLDGVILTDACVEYVVWGERILQEELAEQAQKHKRHRRYLELLRDTEEIYRNLFITCKKRGLYEEAGEFFRKEMVAHRYQYPYGMTRLFSWFVDRCCGYGDRPLRVFSFSGMIIFLWGLLYTFLTLKIDSQYVTLSLEWSWQHMLEHFITCFYFSAVTFTTLGYGDIVPVGSARLCAIVEAFLGAFTIALFVVVFVKKVIR